MLRIAILLALALLATPCEGARFIPWSSGASNGLLTGLVSYYKMDDAANGNAADAHGANTLTDVATDHGSDSTNKKLVSARGITTGEVATTKLRSASADFTPSGSWSWAGWFRPTSITTDTKYLVGVRDGTDRMYALLITDTYTRVSTSDDGATFGSTDSSFGPLSVDTWYFIAFGYDGTNQWISVNAQAKTSDAVTAPFNAATADLCVGNYDSGSEFTAFLGQIDELGFWTRTLTDGDIDTLYGGGTPPAYATFN